jgi:hypothetical protein
MHCVEHVRIIVKGLYPGVHILSHIQVFNLMLLLHHCGRRPDQNPCLLETESWHQEKTKIALEGDEDSLPLGSTNH